MNPEDTGGRLRRAQRRLPTELDETIRRVGRGDAGALAELYDATVSYVYGLAVTVLKSPHAAAAATEEVYAKVWRTAPQFNPRDITVLAWLMSMAHRHFAERAGTMRNGSPPGHDGPGLANGPAQHAHDPGRQRFDAEPARRAVNALDEVDRKAVTLAYFEGYSHTEIARILGLPVSTVMFRLRSGLLSLRDALGGAG